MKKYCSAVHEVRVSSLEVRLDLEETGQPREDQFTYVQNKSRYVHIVVAGEDVDLKLLEPTVRFGFSPKAERKKENRQPKRGMGGRHAATTQGFPQSIRPTFTECLSF